MAGDTEEKLATAPLRASKLRPVQKPATTLPESLSGLIERVTFHNEENGWAALKVKAKGHRDWLSLVGSLPSVSAGEWITAQGHWIRDREFGLQFRAAMIAESDVIGTMHIRFPCFLPKSLTKTSVGAIILQP